MAMTKSGGRCPGGKCYESGSKAGKRPTKGKRGSGKKPTPTVSSKPAPYTQDKFGASKKGISREQAEKKFGKKTIAAKSANYKKGGSYPRTTLLTMMYGGQLKKK